MTDRDEVLAMAREADRGFGTGVLPTSIIGEDAIERFFRLAQAAAYERAAVIVRSFRTINTYEEQAQREYIKAIRALKEGE